jgi:hypothetical protein
MSLNMFLKAKSVVTVFFGVCMLFFNSILMSIYGIALDQSGMMMTQWSGVSFLGIGLICWFASNATESNVWKGVILSRCICDSTGFVVTLIWQLKGVANMLGWLNVALWFIFAAGLGYFQFLDKKETQYI